MYSHTGHTSGKVGTTSNHALSFITNNTDRATLTTLGSLSTTVQGTLWGASNDGSGSGLDADTLDGQQATAFLGATATAVEAFSLDIDDTRNDGTRVPNDYADHKVTVEFTNQISPLGAWWAALTVKGWHDGYAPWQLIGHASTGQNINLYARFGHGSNNTFSSLYKIWHEGVDGSGSGLDADTVDGVQGSSFLRSDATDTCSGQITHTNKVIIDHNTSTMLQLKPTNGSPWVIGIIRDDLAVESRVFEHNPSSQGVGWVFEHRPYFWNSGGYNKFLTTADEGSGNGLDADTVDGLHASSFCRTDTTFTFNASGNDINLDYDNNRNIVRIQRSGTEKFMLGAAGNEIKISMSNGGYLRFQTDVVPQANNTYDLGSTSNRWRNVYTQDLQLSNEAKKDEGGNDVDGSWGDWTLQEGEDDVFMINNRSGKKFRIKMEEVS